MNIKNLFNSYGHEYVAQRTNNILSDGSTAETLAALIKLAAQVVDSEPVMNEWVLERADGKLRVQGVEGSEETFRMMTAGEIAGLDCAGIYPAKLRDAVEILEEFSFFKL